MKTVFMASGVLALAGAASAGSFFVQGAVDFGGPGNFGSPLTVDGTLTSGFISQWVGNPTESGIAISSSSAAPSNGLPAETPGAPGFGASSYTGAYFIAGGVPSGTTPDGKDGVFLMNLVGDFTSVAVSSVNVLIGEDTDASGGPDLIQNINFSALETGGTPKNAGESYALGQDYLIRVYDGSAGNKEVWLVQDIPAPRAVAAFGVAGLAATRRRRR